MKPSELLRAAKARVLREQGFTCIAMKEELDLAKVCHYYLAGGNEVFLAARNYLWKYRTWSECEGKGDPYFNSFEERIKGITKAIADAEAAGE